MVDRISLYKKVRGSKSEKVKHEIMSGKDEEKEIGEGERFERGNQVMHN